MRRCPMRWIGWRRRTDMLNIWTELRTQAAARQEAPETCAKCLAALEEK